MFIKDNLFRDACDKLVFYIGAMNTVAMITPRFARFSASFVLDSSGRTSSTKRSRKLVTIDSQRPLKCPEFEVFFVFEFPTIFNNFNSTSWIIILIKRKKERKRQDEQRAEGRKEDREGRISNHGWGRGS